MQSITLPVITYAIKPLIMREFFLTVIKTELFGINIMKTTAANVPTNLTYSALGYFHVMDFMRWNRRLRSERGEVTEQLIVTMIWSGALL